MEQTGKIEMPGKDEAAEKEGLKISYMTKENYVCPVCKHKFRKEEILTGSGRLIAGELTDELHRLYEPSARYGDIYPLSYTAVVCPACLFSSMNDDFDKLPGEAAEQAAADSGPRREEIGLILPPVNFNKPRDLFSGAASQYLALRCYDYYPAEFSPTVKQGLAALRAGWLFTHLDEKHPGQHYDWLSLLFKKKACFLYRTALKNETSGKETLSGLKVMGPDFDKNYNYEGFLYIAGLLEFKYGDREDGARRKEAITEAKRTLAKMFGLGKSSKSKPGPLLEKSRALYDEISKELQEFDTA